MTEKQQNLIDNQDPFKIYGGATSINANADTLPAPPNEVGMLQHKGIPLPQILQPSNLALHLILLFVAIISCTPRVATIAVNDNVAVETVQQVDKPLFRLGEPFGDVSKPEVKAVEELKDVALYIEQSKERSEERRAILKATVRIDTVVREVESCVHDTVFVRDTVYVTKKRTIDDLPVCCALLIGLGVLVFSIRKK